MALSPYDLFCEDTVNQHLLDDLERYIDERLRHLTPKLGKPISISLGSGAIGATGAALVRRYEEAGWRNVRIHEVPVDAISLTCPNTMNRPPDQTPAGEAT